MAEAKPKLASHGQATLASGTLRPTQNLASARPLRASTFGALQCQIQRLSRGSGSLLATLVGDAWRLGAARRAHREWRLVPASCRHGAARRKGPQSTECLVRVQLAKWPARWIRALLKWAEDL